MKKGNRFSWRKAAILPTVLFLGAASPTWILDTVLYGVGHVYHGSRVDLVAIDGEAHIAELRFFNRPSFIPTNGTGYWSLHHPDFGDISIFVDNTDNVLCTPDCPDTIEVLHLPDGLMADPMKVTVEEHDRGVIRIYQLLLGEADITRGNLVDSHPS